MRKATFGGWLAAVFFPERCAACGEVVPYRQGFCGRCRESLPRIVPPVCPLCGREKAACDCRGRRRHYERCVMPFWYEGAVKPGIRQLKETGCRYTMAAYAGEIAAVIRREYGEEPFDLVTAAPLHPRTRQERGFDQAQRLGRAVAEELGVPYADTLCKLYETKPQKELPARERSGNLLGVFDVREGSPVQGARILLVDDVVTTGATLDECAKMLKLFGAREVYAAAAAGTRPPKKKDESPSS